jgi:DNA-binding response OmpR family regulator
MPDWDLAPPSRGRILIADDEPHIRRILTTLLETAGYEIHPMSDGTGAMEALAGDTPYRLALLDIMMPGFTGLEILKRLRSLPHREDLPVVILTAKGQDADRKAAFELGANEFLTKPFSPKKLLARIRDLIESA